MIICKIPKKSGGERTIYKPSYQEKAALRALLPELNSVARSLCPDCVHGFMPDRNVVTNAACHVGYQFTLCMDLADFFDTVTAWHVGNILGDDVCGLVLVDGAARQGLPTSPAVSNIAGAAMDAHILSWLHTDDVYTRYADDLTVSTNNYARLTAMRDSITSSAERFRFRVNQRKTRIQCAGNGRRIITGVAVDDKHVYPTRRVRRKLRAAVNQQADSSARGLREWCRLKTPNAVKDVPQPLKRGPRLGSVRAIDLLSD